MKPVAGSITSSQPISLKKAARVLSSFVSTETGASQAVVVYLKRASAAFDELVQFHKDLKSRKSEGSNSKKIRSREVIRNLAVEVENRRREGSSAPFRTEGIVKQEDGFLDLQNSFDEEKRYFDDGRKIEKKKKRQKSLDELDGRGVCGIEDKKLDASPMEKKKRKKVEENELDASNEKHGSIKKKRKKTKFEAEGELI